MIPFFRKIRKQLADENKVGKYLRYAIGEIVLVVIGIVIALQINTWKNDTQNRKLEHIYLKNLEKDLYIQKEINATQLEFEQDIISKGDSAILFLSGELGLDDFIYLLKRLSWRRTFIANNVTFQNMGSTGNSIHIRKAKILNTLIRYNQLLEYSTRVINTNNTVLIDGDFGQFVNVNSFGIKMDEQGNISMENGLDGEERYLLSLHLVKRKQYALGNIERMDSLNVNIDEVIKTIDDYLK